MIDTMIQYISIFITFFMVNWAVWYTIEKKDRVPGCLRYRPFTCRICCTFWTLLAAAGGFAAAGWYIAAGGTAAMAVLNAIAMKIHQKKNTVTL